MTRPAPSIVPREIVARLVLEPNGGHHLEIAVPSGVVSMIFTQGQIRQLKRAIAGFEERISFEEGRSDREVLTRRSIPIEIG